VALGRPQNTTFLSFSVVLEEILDVNG